MIRQLAASGNGLIFTTSFGFMNPTVRVAKQFPKVKFEHATGYQTAPNLAVYNARFYEGRAVCGAIAGHISKSGIVGYIGSFPIPEVVMGINAFTLAMRKVKPDAQVKVVWVNSWYDPGQGGRCRQGADRPGRRHHLPAHRQPGAAAGRPGARRARLRPGLRHEGLRARRPAHRDPRRLVGLLHRARPGGARRHLGDATASGTGLKEGMVKMAPYGHAVTDEAAQAAEAVKEGIIAGTLHPFAGPVTNQAGEVVIAEGEHASDEELQKMDWYVEGVQA